jgi:hypothetical protein
MSRDKKNFEGEMILKIEKLNIMLRHPVARHLLENVAGLTTLCATYETF